LGDESFGLGAAGRRGFPKSLRFWRAGRGGAESERAFPQGIEHPQFLRNGPGGQIAAQGALACEDPFRSKLMMSGIVARIAASGQRGRSLDCCFAYIEIFERFAAVCRHAATIS
jgi:hypothetical protein